MYVAGDSADAQTVIAICAVLISVFSLIVSIRAMKLQQRHDKKSVQPIPQIIVGDYENRLYVAIENAGVGPLIINHVAVSNVQSNEIKSSIIAHMPDLPYGVYWEDFSERIEGRAISAQKRLVLLEFKEDPDCKYDGLRNDIRTALGYLLVKLNASDIYGDKLPPCTRRLDWFHRLILVGPNKAAEEQ